MFFQSNQPQMPDTNQELTPDEAKKLAEALQQFTQELREMLQKMLNGEPLTPEEMEKLDQMVNADQMNDMRYQQQLARQMEQALKFREVREALEALMQMLQEMGMNRERLQQMKEMLEANQKALQEQLFQHAGERILRNMSQQPRDRLNGLYNRPFQNISEEDMQVLRREVQRLAAALRTRLALRLRRAHNGQLDVKGTLRANLKYGSVPLELKHRSHTLKPKIVVICDISTSMRHVSELDAQLAVCHPKPGQQDERVYVYRPPGICLSGVCWPAAGAGCFGSVETPAVRVLQHRFWVLHRRSHPRPPGQTRYAQYGDHRRRCP